MRKCRTSVSFKEFESKLKLADKTEKMVTISLANRLIMRVMGKKRNKYWYFRNPVTQKFDRIGIYPQMTLKMANQRVNELLYPHLADKPKEITFGDLAAEWLATKRNTVRFKNIRKSVEYLSPLNDIPVKEIRNVKVKEIILAQQITPYKIQEVLSCACNIMDLAIENEIIDHHALAVLKKSSAFPKYTKDSGFKFVEVDDFTSLWLRISNLTEFWQKYFLLQCLSCLRPGECRQLQKGFLDREHKLIAVPGSLMKIKRATPFRVPVCDDFIKLWDNICKDSDSVYLFRAARSDKPVSESILSVQFKAVCNNVAHPHGFRKSARSYFASVGVNFEVAAMCLDHKLQTGADQVYQQSDLLDLRRDVMQRWFTEVKSHLPAAMLKFFE